MNQPEKLNIWDRFFNRYRRTIHSTKLETWSARSRNGHELYKYQREYIDYLVIDRLTGSEKIERVYLD